jgi:hypothetical protein
VAQAGGLHSARSPQAATVGPTSQWPRSSLPRSPQKPRSRQQPRSPPAKSAAPHSDSAQICPLYLIRHRAPSVTSKAIGTIGTIGGKCTMNAVIRRPSVGGGPGPDPLRQQASASPAGRLWASSSLPSMEQGTAVRNATRTVPLRAERLALLHPQISPLTTSSRTWARSFRDQAPGTRPRGSGMAVPLNLPTKTSGDKVVCPGPGLAFLDRCRKPLWRPSALARSRRQLRRARRRPHPVPRVTHSASTASVVLALHTT